MPYKAINDVNHALREFFALPQAEKDRVRAQPGDPLARGFSSAGNLAATNDGADAESEHNAPDRVEKFVHFPRGNPERLGGANWPELPGFRAAYERYYAEMELLARELSRLFALALGLSEDWFDASIDRHHSNLMANYYPADDRPAGEIRLSQHSDWGNLTILLQDESQSGLQVLSGRGEWLNVPVVPGAFVINIGDLLARWTNDRWVSTVHRVVSNGAGGERYSLPFFHQPNFDAVIECIPTCATADNPPRYEPVVSGPYLLNKFKVAYDLNPD